MVNVGYDANPEARRSMAARLIENLRGRLLNLRNSNKLLNFRFSDRARSHVRIIDELPDVLYQRLIDGRKLAFLSLPDPEDEPEDERSDAFFCSIL
jgi:hypothetical protein